LTKEYGSQAACARHKDVSKQTVTDWKTRGLVVFTERGKVDFAATDRALSDHGIRPQVDAELDVFDLELTAARLLSDDGAELWSKADAERVKENYAARLKQLEYDRESSKVVEIDDVVVAVASEYAIVRNRLLGIGAKLAPDLATLQSAEEIMALIDEEIIEALNELTIDQGGEPDFGAVRESVRARFWRAADTEKSWFEIEEYVASRAIVATNCQGYDPPFA
jgi:phage terminase Nu1 subunit (DNA packaging protein)